MRPGPRSAWIALGLLFACPLTAYVAFPQLSLARTREIGLAIAFAAWLFLIWRFRALRAAGAASFPTLTAIMIVAVALRVALLPAAVSDDVYRYVWEGRVRLAGENPYLKAPDHVDLAGMREKSWPQINHPDFRAIYPPLTELVFTGLAAISATPLMFKSAFVACDLLAIVLLARWLRRRGADARWVLVYALSPLTLWAFAHEAHFDALLVLGLAGVLLTLETSRRSAGHAAAAGAWWGLAVGVKLAPLVLGPWLIARLWRGGAESGDDIVREALSAKVARVLAGLSAAAVVALTPAWFYADAGTEMLAPLRGFLSDLHVFDYPRQVLRSWFGAEVASALTLMIVAGALLLTMRPRVRADQAQLLAIGPLIVLSPTIHPWYLTWLLPALCGRRSWAWLVLIGLMWLTLEATHAREVTGEWVAPEWVGAAMFLPFLATLALQGVGAFAGRGPPPARG